MIRKFSEQLLKALHKEITEVRNNETDAFKVLSAVLKLVRAALKKLREQLKKHPLKDEVEKVDFYKQIKPAFECLRIYELELYNMITDLPPGDSEMLRGHYKKEIAAVQRFFRHIAFHYNYYKLGATDLDAILFVPGNEVQSVLVPEAPELDPEFSTAGSYLFAKIKAFEMLRDYLVKKISGDEANGAWTELLKSLPQWTGEQVNLIELAYGLYYTGQLNHGNAEVKDIIALLEMVFKIKLNSAYHVFGNIRRRKVSSPTRFLDRMRDTIQQRVDEDLSYKPNRGIKLKYPPEK